MKILIFCLPGIGDALMATPMIKIIKEEIPESQIDIACMFDGIAYVFKNNPLINRDDFGNKLYFKYICFDTRINGINIVVVFKELISPI